MKTGLISFLTTGVVFLILDAVWLSTMGPSFYRPRLGSMMLERFSVLPAVAFYLIYVLGLVFFAVTPALAAESLGRAFAYGLLFGLCAYATYDLTNLATLKDWSLSLSLVDMAWGALVSGIAAAAGTKLTLMLGAGPG
jgi:uncharacterized membrane protein